MEIYTQILTLNTNYVNILTRTYYLDENNIKQQLGLDNINGYVNSIYDRERLKQEIPEIYYSEIIDVWGTEPTVIFEEETTLN